MYQFLDSAGNVVENANGEMSYSDIIAIASGLVPVYNCDITITKNGNFFSKVKWR